MPNRDPLRLSQAHLNLLTICPPKFQQVYVDCLGSLPDPERQDSIQWGSKFHLLMQQRELALPIEPLLATDTELDRSLKALIQAVPELLNRESNVWREAEHSRTFVMGSFLFTVAYDLIIARRDRATIFDWKTYRQPPKSKNLETNWQTRLYLYVLAETSEYEPKQIQMTYWFVKSGEPSSVTIDYSQSKHQQAERELTDLLANLKTWLQNYQQFQIDFPHHSNCENCPFYQDFIAPNEVARQQELLASIDDIEEVSI